MRSLVNLEFGYSNVEVKYEPMLGFDYNIFDIKETAVAVSSL